MSTVVFTVNGSYFHAEENAELSKENLLKASESPDNYDVWMKLTNRSVKVRGAVRAQDNLEFFTAPKYINGS